MNLTTYDRWKLDSPYGPSRARDHAFNESERVSEFLLKLEKEPGPRDQLFKMESYVEDGKPVIHAWLRFSGTDASGDARHALAERLENLAKKLRGR